GTGSLPVTANDVYLYGGGLASPTKLVDYYRLDEGSGTSTTDSSGNSNSGTLTNGPTYSSSVPGALSSDPYSLSFNGMNSYVSIPQSSSLNPTSNVTVSLWIDPTRNNGAIQQIFRAVDGSGGSFGYSLAVGAT